MSVASKTKRTLPNVEKEVQGDISSLDEQSRKIINVRILMKDRETARKSNDFGKSDTIRDKLAEEYGVIVKDQVGGPSGWKFKDGSSRKLNAGTKIPDAAAKKRNRESNDVAVAVAVAKKQKKTTKNEDARFQKVDITNTPETLKNKKVLACMGMGGATGSSVRNVQGVLIEDIKAGTGKVAESGKRCKMGYAGRLKSNGKMFDASGNKPFTFRLGRSEVIRGWDIGVQGMREGGKRRLTIPPEKGYGHQGAPPTIPGNATLIFDITLIETK